MLLVLKMVNVEILCFRIRCFGVVRLDLLPGRDFFEKRCREIFRLDSLPKGAYLKNGVGGPSRYIFFVIKNIFVSQIFLRLELATFFGPCHFC